MRIKINFHDRQRDFAVLATFRGKVKALIADIDSAITKSRLNRDAVGALEEASWLLEDLAGKKFWQLQSEAELRGEIEADIADEQIKEAKEARG
jgi:hypothetical protein